MRDFITGRESSILALLAQSTSLSEQQKNDLVDQLKDSPAHYSGKVLAGQIKNLSEKDIETIKLYKNWAECLRPAIGEKLYSSLQVIHKNYNTLSFQQDILIEGNLIEFFEQFINAAKDNSKTKVEFTVKLPEGKYKIKMEPIK